MQSFTGGSYAIRCCLIRHICQCSAPFFIFLVCSTTRLNYLYLFCFSPTISLPHNVYAFKVGAVWKGWVEVSVQLHPFFKAEYFSFMWQANAQHSLTPSPAVCPGELSLHHWSLRRAWYLLMTLSIWPFHSFQKLLKFHYSFFWIMYVEQHRKMDWKVYIYVLRTKIDLLYFIYSALFCNSHWSTMWLQ